MIFLLIVFYPYPCPSISIVKAQTIIVQPVNVQSTNEQPVIVHPVGGLGNQLFQYAAAYALARKRNSFLHICLPSEWENSMNDENLVIFSATDRSNLLWAFNITNENTMFDGYNDPSNDLTVNDAMYFANENAVLDGNVPNDKMINLSGYFESEIFFKNYKKEILRQLTFRENIIEKFKDQINNFASIITLTESVAVHVRRGDFVSENRLIPISYYEDAIKRMKMEIAKDDERRNVTFFVFSDDIDKVKADFENISENFIFVSNKDLSRLADFMLMAMCKHIITGNSTFSWWAAYLNRNENKIVIAPLPKFPPEWYKDQHFEEIYTKIYGGSLTYPSEWIAINPFKS